jgi:hypothetical protein
MLYWVFLHSIYFKLKMMSCFFSGDYYFMTFLASAGSSYSFIGLGLGLGLGL